MAFVYIFHFTVKKMNSITCKLTGARFKRTGNDDRISYASVKLCMCPQAFLFSFFFFFYRSSVALYDFPTETN